MGGACCKAEVTIELNPDGTPKDPQDKSQMVNDPIDLRVAAKQADWAQMRTMLRRMPSVQINSRVPKAENKEEEGYTALHYSVSINHLKGVQKLIRYTASVHVQTAEGKTPLHLALETGKLQVASFLLSKKADINAKDATGASPILNVIASGRRKLIQWTIDECAKYDQLIDWSLKDSNGNSGVLYAAKYGFHDYLKDWVSQSSTCLNVQNSSGETVLGWVLKFCASHLLSVADALELITMLIRRGALTTMLAFEERVPPACLAAATDSVDILKAVLDASGGSPENPVHLKVDALGRTALHYAAVKGAKKTADELMTMGLKPYTLDKQLNSPLHLLCSSGTESALQLMSSILDTCDDPLKALLTPNKRGMTVYHVALMAGCSAPAQNLSLDLIRRLKDLGNKHLKEVSVKEGVILDTPLLLAVQGHQDKVVKTLLEASGDAGGADVNQTNAKGELPLSRLLSSITGPTYEADAAIFDTLLNAGSVTDANSPDDHPLLAICKNSLSNFTERAVKVLAERGDLNWDRKDSKGYSPLLLAAFHNNAWLVRYLIDDEKISPNDPSQKTRPGAPEVVAHSGSLCCKKPILKPGTVGNQTALMCAAKGASAEALKILVQRGADVNAIDSNGSTALAYAMTMDTVESLECARVLLAAGAKTRMPGPKWESKGPLVEILDITGETWVHRAVRYGAHWFVELWARHQGCLEVLATTPEDCDVMPDGSLPPEKKKDIIESVPVLPQAEDEDEDQVVDEDDGVEDSEAEDEQGDEEGDGDEDGVEEAKTADGPVAEGVVGNEYGLGMQEMIANGLAQSFYPGPSHKQLRRWRRQGASWWKRFWVDAEVDLPPLQLEPDLDWEDRYNRCDAGEDELDYEDVLDLMCDQEAKLAQAALPRGGALKAIRTQQSTRQQGRSDSGSSDIDATADVNTPPAYQQSSGSPREGALSELARRLLAKSLSRNHGPAPTAGGPARLGSATVPVAEGVRDIPCRASEPGGRVTCGAELQPGSCSSQHAVLSAAAGIQAEINVLAYRAARQLGLSDEVMLEYGMEIPDLGDADLHLGHSHAGPVAEGKASGSEIKTITMKTQTGGGLAGEPGEIFWANEPYFQPESRYQGVPKYMDESVWPWWPKVDCADQMPSGRDCYPIWVRAKMDGDDGVSKSNWNLDDPEGPWNISAKLAGYKAKKEKLLSGAALRERNIRWYLKSMSPTEFPLKPGQWRVVQKKVPSAVKEAGALQPPAPGEKAKRRNKKVWFGIPDLPFRPELFETSPLVMAVRLGRVSCMNALLKLSSSINIPDGFGLTPIQYAMYMFAKESKSPDMQHIVDMLLDRRPIVSAAPIVDLYLHPRAAKAVEGLHPTTPKKQVQLLLMRKAMYAPGCYDPSDHPTVMDPLILGAVANDTARIAWMVFRCAGNLNESVVSLPQIPTYLNGLMDKVCSVTASKVNPIHVAVLHKNYNTVRQLLDMGADPNAFGREYTGDLKKDRKKKAKLMASKRQAITEMSSDAASMNPMARVWKTPAAGLKKLFTMMKAFISSIELPGMSRPNPWLSALHLSCRLGQAPITFLLLKRGAAPNGSGAAAYAPKSPLEEALAYARNNCRSYNAGMVSVKRPNYTDVRNMAHLDTSDPLNLEAQMQKVEEYKSKLNEKASSIAKARSNDKKTWTAEEVLNDSLSKANLSPSTLALFGQADLENIAIPSMNAEAMAQAAAKAISDAFSAFADPTKMAIKAAALAAKLIVKGILMLMKRPIAHWDPALYCAHVMLYHRAPYNANHRQTSICLRDMIDNATYKWLDLDVGLIADQVWKPKAVNKIKALKTNDKFGYKTLDTTSDPKTYKRTKLSFNNAVEGAYYNIAIEQLGCAYNLPTLVEHLERKDRSGRPAPVTSLSHLKESVQGLMSTSLLSEVQLMQEKVLDMSVSALKNPELANDPDYVANKFPGVPVAELQQMSVWGKAEAAKVMNLDAGMALCRRAAKGGSKGWKNAEEVSKILPGMSSLELQELQTTCQAFVAEGKISAKSALTSTWSARMEDLDSAFSGQALQLAKSKLPAWYVQLHPLGSVEDCTHHIAQRFCGFDPMDQKIETYEGFPTKGDNGQDLNPFEILLGNDLKWKEPDFPEKQLEKLGRSVDTLSVADVVKAVEKAHIQVQATQMKAEQAMRAECFFSLTSQATEARAEQLRDMVASRTQLMKEQAEKLANLDLMDWSDEEVIDAAMDRVNFEIAASKLGPRGKMAAKMLEGAITPDQLKDIMSGGNLDEAAAKIKATIESKLEGKSLEECSMDALKNATDNIDFDAVISGAADDALEAAADVLGSSALGKKAKRLAALDEKISKNPLLADLYKDMKSQLSDLAQEILGDLPDITDGSASLPDFIQDPSLLSLDSMEASLDEMGGRMMDALERANGEILQEAVLGLELDFALDMDAIMEAYSQACDALASILDLLGLDL